MQFSLLHLGWLLKQCLCTSASCSLIVFVWITCLTLPNMVAAAPFNTNEVDILPDDSTLSPLMSNATGTVQHSTTLHRLRSMMISSYYLNMEDTGVDLGYRDNTTSKLRIHQITADATASLDSNIRFCLIESFTDESLYLSAEDGDISLVRVSERSSTISLSDSRVFLIEEISSNIYRLRNRNIPEKSLYYIDDTLQLLNPSEVQDGTILSFACFPPL